MTFPRATLGLIIAVAALGQHAAFAMFCIPGGSSKSPTTDHGIVKALRPKLYMHMYQINSVGPVYSQLNGNSAFYTSFRNQLFVINDGASSSFNPETRGLPHIVARNFAIQITSAFEKTNDWRQAMSAAIASLQTGEWDGTTSALVVRNIRGRNYVEVYSLGDAVVVLLRWDKKTNSYKVRLETERQYYKGTAIPLQITGQKGSTFAGSTVEDMVETRFDVEEGDLVIGGSRTLWNIIGREILATMANRSSPSKLPDYLIQAARTMGATGDISVVVGRILSADGKRPTPDQGLIPDHHNCHYMNTQWL